MFEYHLYFGKNEHISTLGETFILKSDNFATVVPKVNELNQGCISFDSPELVVHISVKTENSYLRLPLLCCISLVNADHYCS